MPSGAPPSIRTLTLRELNRALLARQMLLARQKVGVVDAIERLGALQAQWPRAPYVGLWSRIAPFARDDLERAIGTRRVVKATLMRGTLHLVSARDYPYYAVATREARRALFMSTQRQLVNAMAKSSVPVRAWARGGRMPIPDPDRFHETLLRFATTPRSRDDFVELIEKKQKVPRALATFLVWNFIAAHGMLVHEPDSALFAANRAGDVVAARVVFPKLATPDLRKAALRTVTRHLAAFGPATVDDISSWTSMRTPSIREALAALGARVRTFADERGRVLYDLAASPRPGADAPAVPRYLPKWDSTLLAYTPVERTRILPERYRKVVIGKNGDIAQTILIDGMVAGTWALERKTQEAAITVTAFARIGKSDRSALVDGGEELARFLAPDARGHAVRIG